MSHRVKIEEKALYLGYSKLVEFIPTSVSDCGNFFIDFLGNKYLHNRVVPVVGSYWYDAFKNTSDENWYKELVENGTRDRILLSVEAEK